MMVTRSAWLNVLVLSACLGCGGMAPPPVDQPVTVSGKVSGRDGKPISNVALNLQPLENGYAQTVQVKPDGTFSLATQPGKYAYYFSPKSGAKAMPPQVAQAREASMDRTVLVASGQSLDIQLP